MARKLTTPWPTRPRTAFFDDVASRATLRAAARAGRIKQLAPGLWTADLHSDPEVTVAENRWSIIARSLPDAVVVDRSAAFGGRIAGGVVTVASDARSRAFELPGLTVLVRPRQTHATDMPWADGLTTSAPPRTIVDNLVLSRSRGRTARTLSIPELQDWLADKALTWDIDRLSRLRADAIALAGEWGHEDRIPTITALFDELTGKRPMRRDAGSYARAVADGSAWDTRRLTMFAAAADQAAKLDFQPLVADREDGELPFFEAYFSNYIEGTEFTISDARTIIETQTPPARRSADGHDILGTYRCVIDPIGRASTSTDVDTFVELLRTRHQTIMIGRPDVGPGQFKTDNNRVASIDFVDHRLVPGTLRRGLNCLESIPPGFARAVYVMFVVAEVHPFTDGNGRVARLMMNAELSAVGACRIVIPTVLRNEYVSALRRASANNGDLSAAATVLRHAWRWTVAMPWTDRAATDGQLEATNALTDSNEAAERHLQLELP